MIIAIRDHQHKSHGLRDALRECGHWVVPIGTPADVLLIDHDIAHRGNYRPIIEQYKEWGARIVLYPHGANILTSWDGPEEPYPVDACLVIGTGHREIMQIYGYPHPIHVVGWWFCEQRRFKPRHIKRVLFAPTHPLGNGYLNPELQEGNRSAYETLLEWGLDLTVRHVGALDINGLKRERGVSYEPADLTLSLGHIDDYDLVVGRETILSLAIARGIPAVIHHEPWPDNDPHSSDEPMVKCASYDSYRELMAYPYHIKDPQVRHRAGAAEAKDWRERFIGPQLDPQVLSDTLDAICREPAAA